MRRSLSCGLCFKGFDSCGINRSPVGVGGLVVLEGTALFGFAPELIEIVFVEDGIGHKAERDRFGNFVLELSEIAQNGADRQGGSEDSAGREGYVLLDEAVFLGDAEVAEGDAERALVVATVFRETFVALLKFEVFAGTHEVGQGAVFCGLGEIEPPGGVDDSRKAGLFKLVLWL